MKFAVREDDFRTYQFGPFRLVPERLLLMREGRPAEVGPKALELLVILVEKAGQVVDKKDLMDRLWPDTFVEENNLAQAVSSLRQALAEGSDSPQYVKTVPRRGYMFAHPVREIWDGNLAGPKEVASPVLTSVPAVGPGEPGAQEKSSISPIGDRTSVRSLESSRAVALVAVGVVIVSALLVVFTRSIFRPQGVSTRSTIAPPPGWEFFTTGDMNGSLVLSPNGANAIFGVRDSKSQSMLFLRRIDSLTSEPLAGTEGAAMPFWSPDGTKIGFFADEKLKTLRLADQSMQVVCDLKSQSPRGGTWETSDTILFAESTRGPILKVSANGGSPTPVTDLTESHFTTHRWPESLPDGKHFLFLAANHNRANSSKPAVFLGSLDGHPPRFLVESDSNALLVAGEVLFVSGGKLLAQPFDPDTGRVGVTARMLADTVEYDRTTWHAAFVATPRLLAYRERPGTPEAQVITFLNDSGKMVRTAGRPGNFQGVSISPDGKTVAASCDNPEMNICLINQDGTLTRISDEPIDTGPVWAPDGSTLVYVTHRGTNRFGLVLKDLKAQTPERVLTESDDPSVNVTSWSPSQKELLIEHMNSSKHLELGAFQIADQKCRHFLSSSFNVSAGRFSPDGKWVAYQSDESGKDQVYIASYPDPIEKYVVSHGGGRAARWGPDGRDLYFLDASDMIHRVRIEPVGTGLKVGAPQPLFRPPILPPPLDSESFEVTGKEPLFVINSNTSKSDSEYVLVTFWKQ